MPRTDDFRGDLAKAREIKREQRNRPTKSYICISGNTAGLNPLLGMVACSEGAQIKRARLFIPELETDQWAYTIMVGTGITFYTVVDYTPLDAGFNNLGDLKLLPTEVAIIRAHYSGDAVEDFEYCLDYAIEVK